MSRKHDEVHAPRWYTGVPFFCGSCGETVEPLTISQHLSFPLGSVLKYCVRAGVKDTSDFGIQDLEKAKFYIDTEIRLRQKYLQPQEELEMEVPLREQEELDATEEGTLQKRS